MTQHDTESTGEPYADADNQASGHVDANDLAAYIDNGLSSSARATVTAHVAECDQCRHELTAVRRLVAPNYAARSGGVVKFGAALLAAAAVVVIAVGRPSESVRQGAAAAAESTRATDHGQLSEVEVPFPVVTPTADSSIPVQQVVLMWRSMSPDATYRVIIQDETGGIAFTRATGDTVTPVPASVFANHSPRYFWSVEARLSDGRAISSAVQRFRVR